MKFGPPNAFLNKSTVRIAAIDRAVAQFEHSSKQLMAPYRHMVDEHTMFYLKGFGNEINLLAAFRDLYFNSRELLDLLIAHIATATKKSGKQTPSDFLPFAKSLMAGELDHHNLKTIAFLKEHFGFIFHIRAIRNEIKRDPSVVEFFFNTKHFEARIQLPAKPAENNLLQHLTFPGRDDALKNGNYSCTMNMDIAFPEMKAFWAAVQEVRNKDDL